MPTTKADIITRLRRDILWQQFKPISGNSTAQVGLGPIEKAFPNNRFPAASVHEFCSVATEDAVASTGFISGLLSMLMRDSGAAVWIGPTKKIFPPALAGFGIDPDKIIFITLQKERDIAWAMEEALKCNGLAAVVGEMPDISFTVSRRLQLAVEQSRVTGFILRHSSRNLNTTACVSRWKIRPLASGSAGLPGVGFPRWNVELVKIRNGRPGSWQVEWSAGKFRHLSNTNAIITEQQKKAG
jgi:protein ImuA